MAGIYRDASGREVYGENNAGDTGATYNLASNVGIAATSGTAAVPNVRGGSYIFDAQFTGTSLALQALGADQATWRTVTTLNASGSAGVVIGEGSTLRLYNPNSGALSGVYASLT